MYHEFLIAIAAALIAIIVSEFIQYVKKQNDIEKKKKNAIRAILKELDDHIKFIDERKKKTIEKEGTILRHNGAYFQRAAFDSVIFSGIFIEFDSEIQILLSNTYEPIKVANQLTLQIQKIFATGDFNSEQITKTITAFSNSHDESIEKIKKQATKVVTLLKTI